MKYIYINKAILNTLCFLGLVTIAGTSFAQNTGNSAWQLGLGVGYTNYYGDVSYYRVRKLGDFYKTFRFIDYNKYYHDRPSFSVLLEKRVTPTLGFLLQANSLQFSMSDRYRNKDGSFDVNVPNYSRSLNFRTNLQDAGLAFTFNTNNGKFLPVNSFFYPSFYLGAGVSKFTVKGDLFDANGAPYNYNQPSTNRDDQYETDLRDIRTETEEKYSNVEPYANLGLALNFRLSEKFTIAIQSDIKYSASDYLDDVSGRYKASYPTPREQYIARPGYNVVNPVTLRRGDDDGVNDIYINNRVVLNFGLSGKPKPKVFKAPVIYSLSMPFTRQKDTAAAKAVVKQDSAVLKKIDSLIRANNDTLRAVRDSMNRQLTLNRNDSDVQNELQSITGELREIKNLLRSQQSTPRYQQLQYQVDSLNRAKSKILQQRTRSREDNLRLQIYNLQLDSLRTEMNRLQNQSQNPGNAGMTQDQYDRMPVNDDVPATIERRFNDDAGNQDRSFSMQADTVSTADIRVLDNEVKNLKKDRRYRTNTAYRRSVDSLARKVEAQRRVRNTNQRNLNRGAASSDQARADSMEQRLNELERQMQQREQALSDSPAAQEDTAAFSRDIGALETRLKQNADSLALLQNQLKRSSDSAAYYRRVSFAESDANAVEAPRERKTFFQRVFGRKDKTKEVRETPASADTMSTQTRVSPPSQDSTQKKRTFFQRLFKSDKNKGNATTENDNPPENEQNVSQAESRTQPSSEGREVQVDSTQKKPGFFRKIFKKEPKEEVISVTPANRNLELERYYNANAERMRATVEQVERRNRELVLEYERVRSERDRAYAARRQTAPPVVYQRDNSRDRNRDFNDRNYNDRDYNEISLLRSELARLRGEVNQSNQQSNPQPIYIPQPVPVQTDTSQVNSLRSELEMIRAQLESLKDRQPVVVEKPVVTKENFDVKNFPVISVYFKMGATTLSGDQVGKIGPVSQVARENANAIIVLKGFTDPVGNPATNQAIAKKRTNYVKTLLVSRYRIPEDRIISEEPGLSDSGRSKRPNPLDRRVDLKFE